MASHSKTLFAKHEIHDFNHLAELNKKLFMHNFDTINHLFINHITKLSTGKVNKSPLNLPPTYSMPKHSTTVTNTYTFARYP